MDFTVLSQLREQSQSLHSRRHQAATDHYQKGLELFARAASRQFRDKQSLRAAFDHWIEAMRAHRQNPAPCIGVGYIFLILGDDRNALNYFKAAQRIDPENADAALFLASIQERALQKTARSSRLAQAEDSDALYDQAENLIQLRLKLLMALPAPVPGPELHIRAELARICSEERQNLDSLQQMLDRLDQDLDVSPLQSKLRGLESSLQSFETARQLAEQFAAMAGQMAEGTRSARELLGGLKSGSLNAAEVAIEPLLDLCDQLADQLEYHEDKGYDIDPLSATYQGLIDQVSTLQDALDDAS